MLMIPNVNLDLTAQTHHLSVKEEERFPVNPKVTKNPTLIPTLTLNLIQSATIAKERAICGVSWTEIKSITGSRQAYHVFFPSRFVSQG